MPAPTIQMTTHGGQCLQGKALHAGGIELTISAAKQNVLPLQYTSGRWPGSLGPIRDRLVFAQPVRG